ncbi:MAG: hypothetical protein R6V55_13610, partial [Desulfovermiculus sp.]
RLDTLLRTGNIRAAPKGSRKNNFGIRPRGPRRGGGNARDWRFQRAKLATGVEFRFFSALPPANLKYFFAPKRAKKEKLPY